MQGLGRAKGINIKAEEADGTSPENVLRSAKEKQKLFKDEGIVQIYCLFDKDDCDDEKFNRVIQRCRKAGFVDAVSVPCYEYWLLLHLKRTSQPFKDAQECCETFQSEYNRKFQTQYTVKQLKAKTDTSLIGMKSSFQKNCLINAQKFGRGNSNELPSTPKNPTFFVD